jgi:dethiobiotin synthetase
VRSGLFVTGTDTGVGKTTVACALAAALARRGHRVGVLKPVETGCDEEAGGVPVPADALRLRFFSGTEQEIEAICPRRFRSPVAPAVAARLEGAEIDPSLLADGVRRIVERHDVTLVEGAGGLLVPISGTFTFADLAHRCALPVLVVVGNRLGALNHALLTVRWADKAGLEIAGYVVNALGPDEDLAARTNVETLAELLGPPIAVFPWLGQIEPTEGDRTRLAETMERVANLDRLL